jgi:hypothetical protein
MNGSVQCCCAPVGAHTHADSAAAACRGCIAFGERAKHLFYGLKSQTPGVAGLSHKDLHPGAGISGVG